MALLLLGRRTVSYDQDREGYRTYKVKYLVLSDDINDGPANIDGSSVLPQYGDPYVDNNGTVDNWATCKLDTEIKLHEEREGERGVVWEVTKTFTNKPDGKRCKKFQIDNPLLVNPEVTMSFVRYTEEATADRFGMPIVNSAFEQIRGQQNEWDMCRAQIKIVQNVEDPQIDALVQMVDTVNSVRLWPDLSLPGSGTDPADAGFPPRTVKLSEAPIEWLYTEDCDPYYRRTLVFDIRYRAKVGITTEFKVGTGTGTGLVQQLNKDQYYDTFDRYVMDEGTKVLNGHWDKATGAYVLDPIGGSAPDPTNPRHFIKFIDKDNKNTRVPLDGHGVPANVPVFGVSSGTGATVHPIAKILVEYYGESDFTLLKNFPISLVPVLVQL